MGQRIVLEVVDGQLLLRATPMSVAEINLLLDLGKKMLLDQQGPDEVLEETEAVRGKEQERLPG